MKKNDWIIIGLGLVIALAVYGGLQLNRMRYEGQERRVEVYIDGVLQESFSLEEEGIHRYETDWGYNTIEIADGEVGIIEADCPTQSCIHDGPIHSVSETVVCLPHHFHIEITGDEEVDIDAISQ